MNNITYEVTMVNQQDDKEEIKISFSRDDTNTFVRKDKLTVYLSKSEAARLGAKLVIIGNF